ncbi:MAG: proton-conducting transporter membrane subunit [Elusimicrobiota bacterium]
MNFFLSFLFFYSADNFFELSLFLILMPAAMGIISFFVPTNTQRRKILFMGAFFHFLLTMIILLPFMSENKYPAIAQQTLLLSSFSCNTENAVFLAISSALFLGACIYSLRYLQLEERNIRKDEEGFILNDEPEALFTAFMLFFLSAMTLVCLSSHMGLLWAAVEATTLFSAPLIYFHRSRKSLEATWKYLVVCSVGIAIALLGTFFLSLSASNSGGSLYLSDLLTSGTFNTLWLKLAFVFLFVGYGTKMGLAPLHTWLPDAHSEAPSVVSALLSGALLNCAFLGIWKSHSILASAGLGNFSSSIMTAFGLFTVLISAVFILNQREYKRALAYSSVENMGLMSLLLGISGASGIRSVDKLIFINAAGHSLIKAGMFFAAGMILFYYKTKKVSEVGEMAEKTPFTAFFWFLGFILLAGAPPSPLFFPKFFIFKAFLMSGNYLLSFLMFFLFTVIFAGFARMFLSMVFAQAGTNVEIKEEKIMLLPSGLFFFAGTVLFFLFFYFSRG